jgi:hypothetical protein
MNIGANGGGVFQGCAIVRRVSGFKKGDRLYIYEGQKKLSSNPVVRAATRRPGAIKMRQKDPDPAQYGVYYVYCPKGPARPAAHPRELRSG